MEIAKPYLVGILVSTVVGFFFGWMFFLLPVIVMYVFYVKFKRTMSEQGINMQRINKEAKVNEERFPVSIRPSKKPLEKTIKISILITRKGSSHRPRGASLPRLPRKNQR